MTDARHERSRNIALLIDADNASPDALDPVLTAIHRLVDDLAEGDAAGKAIHEETLQLVLMAMGDALLGRAMANALGLPPETARTIATRALIASRSGESEADSASLAKIA